MSTGALIVAGVLAYYRYFRGRIFSTRAQISINGDVIASPDGQYLHAITILFENVGTVTIWRPAVIVYVVARQRNNTASQFEIHSWYSPEGTRESTSGSGVVDSGETALFFTEQLFSADVWSVRYTATVRSEAGDVWTAIKTVKNLDVGFSVET